MEPSLLRKLQVWLHPIVLLSIAIYWYIAFALPALLRSPRTLFNGQVRAQAFARFWLSISPPADSPAQNDPMPGAFAPLPALLASASGTVLELGPGTGTLMAYLDPSRIQNMYGAEPGADMHAALRASANAVGFRENFEILACGAEPESLIPALASHGALGNGRDLFDTILCVRSLCSVQRPEATVEMLYRLLKPGGKIVICEHVVNPWREERGSVVGRALQVGYTALGWPFFVGDCRLSRDTVRFIREAGEKDGGWGKVELTREIDWAALPFVLGTFVKKSG